MFKKGEGGRQAGAVNKKKKAADKLDKILNAYSPEAIIQAFERARKRNGKKSKKRLPIIDHLCELAYNDTTLALALIKKIQADKKSGEVERKTEGSWSGRTPMQIVEDMNNLTSCRDSKDST